MTYTTFNDYTIDYDGLLEDDVSVISNIELYDEIDNRTILFIDDGIILYLSDIEDYEIEEDYDGRTLLAVDSNNIDEVELIDKTASELESFCKSRGLVFSFFDDDFWFDETINKFKELPLTKRNIVLFFNETANMQEDINESIMLPVKQVKPTKIFKDTEYGDLTGRTYEGHIDITGYGIESLEGCPKIIKNGNLKMKGNKLTNIDLRWLPSYVNTYNSTEFDAGWDQESTNAVEELGFRQRHPETYGADSTAVRGEIYNQTGNTDILPDELKDIFFL